MIEKLKRINWLPILLALCLIAFVCCLFFGNKEENVAQLGYSSDNFTPFIVEGWSSGLITRPEYDSNGMPNDALVESLNIDLNVKSSIAPRTGSIILGTATSTECPIKSMHTSKDINGRELLLTTSCGTIDWWNSVDEDWDQLDDGYTSGQVFTFADGSNSDETPMYTYFANGKETLRRFSVAFGTVASNTSTAVVLNSVTGYTSAANQGFSSTGGTSTINGIDYTYTELNGLTLQGISGLPTFDVDEGVVGVVETNGFTDPPNSAASLLIKDNRLYVAYKSNVYASQIDDLQNFSFSAPREGSEGDITNFPTGGDITAVADRGNYVAVFKKNYIGSIEYMDYDSTLFDIARLDTIASGINVGAVNNKGITQKDYSVIYTTDDIGISKLAQAEQSSFDTTLSLTENIRPTAEDYNFSDTAVIIWENKVLSSVRETDSSSFNDIVLLYDSLYDRFSELTSWNVGAWSVYNNKLYYGDSVSKNVYQAFYDDYSDDGIPYTTQAKTKWFNFQSPSTWKEIGHLFVEGWITKNTDITFSINLDEGGKLTQKEVTIEGSGSYVQSDPPSGSFGLDPFGINSFSPVSNNTSDSLKHFAVWINVDDIFENKFRNMQFEIYTSGDNQNYRIMRIIPYINILDDNYMRDNNEDIYIN